MNKKEFLIFVVVISLLLVLLVFAAPSLTTVTLSSSNDTDTYLENLSITTDQDDNSSVKLIYNWYRNGTSLAVLNMPFENNTANTSSTTKDYSGNGNNGTVTSATWDEDGGYGGNGAYSFDGDDDKIIISDTFGIGAGGEATISTWVNLDSESESGVFVKIGDGSTGFGIGVGLYGGNWDSNGNTLIMLFEGKRWINTLINIGTGWHHVTMVIDSNGDPYAYIDGVQVFNQTGQADASAPVGETGIGGYANGRYVDVIIDDLLIYNFSLNEEKIAALYENRTDLIVSQETGINDTWNATVTPNDGSVDGAARWSNTMTILEEPAEEEEAEEVPEFSDYAIALLLLTVVGGFFAMRRKEM